MKNIIRTLCIILSAVCIALNIGPVITNAQINIGIIFGFCISAVFFIFGIKFEEINGAVARLWEKAFGKVIIIVTSLCVTVGIVVFSYTFCRVVTYSMPSQSQTEYIIVLGCKINGTEPGIYLRSRLNKAKEYLDKHPESKAILSGGQGVDEDISEAQCMHNYLIQAGIDEERLIVEAASTSTFENFRNSVEILKSKGISINEITVVTNDFHEYRASEFAKKCGLATYSYPCQTPWIGYVPFAVREVFAVVYQIYLK